MGTIPIPPYLKRESLAIDSVRYQTIYAQNSLSIAAPTAGLHFDEPLLTEIKNLGVKIVDIELQISYGTFAPLQKENFIKNTLHKEKYTISETSALILNQVLESNKKSDQMKEKNHCRWNYKPSCSRKQL